MIEFPVLTSPTSNRKDFEDRLIEILNSDWKELIAVSPFVDTTAIQNIWYINEKLHAKFIVKDSELVLFGSQNLTYSGLRRNYELGALIRDNDSVMKARAFAEDIIKGAKEGKLFP